MCCCSFFLSSALLITFSSSSSILELLTGSFFLLKLLLQVLDVLLQLLLVFGTLDHLFLFFLNSGLHVMDNLLHLLLPCSQPCAHLLGLRTQLSLGLQLLGKDVFLFQRLLVLLVQILHLRLMFLQLFSYLLQLGLLLQNLFVVLCHLEQGLDLGIEPPPLPVAELEVGRAVALQDADCIQLLHPLLVVPSGKQSTAVGLELHNKVSNPQITLLFEMGKHSSTEEYF